MADVTVATEVKYCITKMVNGKEKRQHFIINKHRMTDIDEDDVLFYIFIVGLMLTNEFGG
jgi:hypothetical protein